MASFISFIPTRPEYIDSFFELAPVSSSDVVYDLGSGDGRLLDVATSMESTDDYKDLAQIMEHPFISLKLSNRTSPAGHKQCANL